MALSLHLYRFCALALVGVVAGGLHSAFVPVSVVPEAPPPLPPLESPPTPQTTSTTPPSIPVGTQSSPSTPAASSATQKPASDSAAALAKPTGNSDIDITLAQAKALYDQGTMFVDARSAEEFAAKHIEGAVSLPLDAFSGGKRPEALDILDPGARVVIYCGGGDCHASHDVAIRLNAFGYKLCYVMKDGIPAWEAAGYPTMQGQGGGQ